jgi:antitoxin (DNA-binding transcriptional repressor) of toxin-antitoxin stability system
MEHRISSTDLARNLGDVLGRVRYLGDSFIVERNGDPVARLGPVPEGARATVREGLRAWVEAGEPDSRFAEDLARVGEADRPPGDPWGS